MRKTNKIQELIREIRKDIQSENFESSTIQD